MGATLAAAFWTVVPEPLKCRVGSRAAFKSFQRNGQHVFFLTYPADNVFKWIPRSLFTTYALPSVHDQNNRSAPPLRAALSDSPDQPRSRKAHVSRWRDVPASRRFLQPSFRKTSALAAGRRGTNARPSSSIIQFCMFKCIWMHHVRHVAAEMRTGRGARWWGTERIRVPEGRQSSFSQIMMLLKLEGRRQQLELANEAANQASSVQQPDYLQCRET